MSKYIIVAFLLLHACLSTAQTSKWAIRAEAYKPRPFVVIKNPGEANGTEKTRLFGGSIGAERTWRQGTKRRFYQTAMIGAYYHSYFERVLTLETYLGMDRKLPKNLFMGWELGGGRNFAKTTAPNYKLEGGKWVATDEGSLKNSRWSAALSLHLGYHVTPKLDVIGSVGGQATAPFLKVGDEVLYPFFAYTRLNIGARWRF
jgi:hypothetical protein